jgi:hypothetical protein
VSEHEILTSRLTRLADELTPSADPAGQVRAARLRYRRQRRNRLVLSGVAAAVAAAVVGIPTVVGSLSATPERGEVARPSGTTETPEKTPAAPPTGEDARKASRWEEHLDQQAERETRLQPELERAAAVFALRSTPLSLTGPPQEGGCPDWAPVPTTDGGLPTGCRSSGADMAVDVAFVPGTTPEELGADASAEAARDGCSIRAMPNVSRLAPLLLCEEEGVTSWRLRTVDASGAGVWRLDVTLTDSYSGDGAAVLADLADRADRTW